jgi:lysophospholipase L1-like esterase
VNAGTALRYAALGDSNAAGDRHAGPGVRWPDLLADELGRTAGHVEYRNLAVYGVKTADVAADQLPAALSLRPHLITLVCGINDVLMPPRPAIDEYARVLAQMLDDAHAAVPGVRIVTATIPDLTRYVAYRPRSRARISDGFSRLADATRAIAAERDVGCVDLAAHEALHVRSSFGPDGYHPSPEGHRAMARAFLELVGPAREVAA